MAGGLCDLPVYHRPRLHLKCHRHRCTCACCHLTCTCLPLPPGRPAARPPGHLAACVTWQPGRLAARLPYWAWPLSLMRGPFSQTPASCSQDGTGGPRLSFEGAGCLQLVSRISQSTNDFQARAEAICYLFFWFLFCVSACQCSRVGLLPSPAAFQRSKPPMRIAVI